MGFRSLCLMLLIASWLLRSIHVHSYVIPSSLSLPTCTTGLVDQSTDTEQRREQEQYIGRSDGASRSTHTRPQRPASAMRSSSISLAQLGPIMKRKGRRSPLQLQQPLLLALAALLLLLHGASAAAARYVATAYVPAPPRRPLPGGAAEIMAGVLRVACVATSHRHRHTDACVPSPHHVQQEQPERRPHPRRLPFRPHQRQHRPPQAAAITTIPAAAAMAAAAGSGGQCRGRWGCGGAGVGGRGGAVCGGDGVGCVCFLRVLVFRFD